MAVAQTHEPKLNRILACCWFTCLLLASAAAAQQELPDGISLLEDRGLATKLDDARAYLAEERWQEAVNLLQEIADAESSAVISVDDNLFQGAVYAATLLLNTLPAEALVVRQQMLSARGFAELQKAMNPPNLTRLTSIAARYRATDAGDQATQLLQELWRDRGYQELADFHGAAALPSNWQTALPLPAPVDPLTAPVFSSIGALELPRVSLTGLSPGWNFSFSDDFALQNLNHRMAFGYGLGFATNGREVVALELGSGLPRWHFQGPPGWAAISTSLDQTMSGGASPFTLLAPVLADGIVLAVIQEPVPIGRADAYSGIKIRKMMPARRLYAFDALSGEILWRQDVRWMEEQDRQPYELAASPPAVAGGKVYLPIYSASGTVDLSLLCLDLRTGERLWKSFLTSGTMETNLFGNILSELACPPPVADLHRVFVCSHFGTVCALDANNGLAIWTRTYPRTDVKTRQNGSVSPRQHVFRNNPLAYDGQHLVVAPLDSPAAFVLNADDGQLLDLWPAVSNSTYGTMAHLIGLDHYGAWFSGTNIVHQPFSDSGSSRLRFSKAFYEYAGADSSNLYPGVITRNGVLAMSSRGAILLDPDSLQFQGFAVDNQSVPEIPLGPLQAIHGMLLLMTHQGISALVNPSSLIDTLAARNLSARDLRELLWMLETLDFAADFNLGKRLARSAEKMASENEFVAFRDALLFLASRTWLVVGETRQGLEQLSKLLSSSDARLRLAAASLILDVQAEVDPQAPSLGSAILILLEAAPQRVLTRNGGYQPFLASLERAEALAAMSTKDVLEQHDQLVDVLLLENVEDLQVRHAPLQQWARHMLDMLLETPAVQAAHQLAARTTLAQQEVNAASLRAFYDTDAMQDWLRTQLHAHPDDRSQYKKLLRWVYDFGDPHRAWPEIALQLHTAPELPSLPNELRVIDNISLRGSELLHLMEKNGDVYAFLQIQSQNYCQIIRMGRQGAQVVASLDLIPGAESLRSLKRFCYPTATGLSIIYQGRWVHIQPDGTLRERLIGQVLSTTIAPLRIGELVAVLLRDAKQMLRLELIDLETGITVMAQDIEAPAGRPASIVANENWLFLLQDSTRDVQRINLLHKEAPTLFELPFVQNATERFLTSALGEGVAMTTSGPGRAGNHSRGDRKQSSVLIVAPDQAPTTIPLTNLEYGQLPTPTGLGWWSRPSRTLESSLSPITLNWLAPGATQVWRHNFLVTNVQIPQVDARDGTGEISPDGQMLTIQADATDRIELHCIELGATAKPWVTTLDHLPYSALSEPFQPPRRAADGWAVLLRETNSRSQATRLHTFLLHNDGTLRGSYVTMSNARSQYGQEIYLLDHFLVLRNGDLLTLLGTP